MKRFIGCASLGYVGADSEFEFEVDDDATEEDIDAEMMAALWESGVLEVWYEPAEEDAR